MNVQSGTLYRHHRGGRYWVLGVGTDSNNRRPADKVPIVVYLSLTYGEWRCRDVAEFTEIVEWPDGVRRQRFVPAAEVDGAEVAG